MPAKRLHISDRLALPLDAVTNTFAIMARRRVGKTYTASVMAEEMVSNGIPWVALDPTGAWWGIRSSADGKAPGFPVIVIGGDHGDVPLEPTAGKVIADLVVDHPGWYIVDMSAFESDASHDRFAMEFGERLYRRKQKSRFPMHLFVDEADMFAPQRPFHGQERMLGAYEAIVRRGGIRGLGITLISQRPAVVNKNVLTQCETLITLTMSAPQDQDAIDDWIKRNGTPEQRTKMMSSLASLKTGQAWFWSPSWLDKFELIQIRQRTTFNSSATPKHGEKVITPDVTASVDLTKLGQDIQATIEKVKADDPKALRAEIGKLKLQVKDLESKPAEVKTERIEIPIIDTETKQLLSDFQQAIQLQAAMLTKVDAALAAIRSARPNEPIRPARIPPPAIPRRPIPTRPYQPPAEAATDPDFRLAAGPRKILTYCAQYPDGVQRDELTVLSGFKRSTRDTYLQRLSEAGLVRAQGRTILITDAGFAALGPDFEPLPIGSDLRAYWMNRLPAGEKRLLQVLVDHYPDEVTREELSEATDFKRSTRDTYLQRMISKRLVENIGASRIRASANLFD